VDQWMVHAEYGMFPQGFVQETLEIMMMLEYLVLL